MKFSSVFALLGSCGAAADGISLPSDNLFPTWVLTHQVWECGADNCGSNQSSSIAWLDAWAARNISVGSINIDSGWAVGFNNFAPRTDIFPDFPAFVSEVHGRGVRMTLWMTSMVDTDSPNYADALSRGFFVRDASGAQAGNISWWHGRGGLLDYSQPAARAWWEAQMDAVLKLPGGGVDGFKYDYFLAGTLSDLREEIRTRLIQQFIYPFKAIRIAEIATAFNLSPIAMEKELERLISKGLVKARIDSHNKVLQSRFADQRGVTFQLALETGEEMVREIEVMLLRASMLQQHFTLSVPKSTIMRGF